MFLPICRLILDKNLITLNVVVCRVSLFVIKFWVGVSSWQNKTVLECTVVKIFWFWNLALVVGLGRPSCVLKMILLRNKAS